MKMDPHKKMSIVLLLNAYAYCGWHRAVSYVRDSTAFLSTYAQ